MIWRALILILLALPAFAAGPKGKGKGKGLVGAGVLVPSRGASPELIGAILLARAWDHCYVSSMAGPTWPPYLGIESLAEVGTAAFTAGISTSPLGAAAVGTDNVNQAITIDDACWNSATNQTITFPVTYTMAHCGVPDSLRMSYLGSGSSGCFFNYSAGNGRYELNCNDDGGGGAGTFEDSRFHPDEFGACIISTYTLENDGAGSFCLNGWCQSLSFSALSADTTYGTDFGLAVVGFMGSCLDPAHDWQFSTLCYQSGSDWTEAAELAVCRAAGVCAPAASNPAGLILSTGFESSVQGYHCGGEATGFAPELDAPSADCDSAGAAAGGQGANLNSGESAIRYEFSTEVDSGVLWTQYIWRETATRDPTGGSGTGGGIIEMSSGLDNGFDDSRTGLQVELTTDLVLDLNCAYPTSVGDEAFTGVAAQSSGTWAAITCGYDFGSDRGLCWAPRAVTSGVPTAAVGVASHAIDCSALAPRDPVRAAGVHNYSPSGGDLQLDNMQLATDFEQLGGPVMDNSYSVFLDGVNDYVSIAHDADTLAFTTSYTFAGWFYFDTLAVNDTLIRKLSTASNIVIHARLRSGDENRLIVFIGSTSNRCEVDTDHIAAGTWYHLAVVYDGSLANDARIRIYQDGAQVACTRVGTIPTDLTSLSNTAQIRIGDAASGMEGNIDELVIYDRALSGAEVTSLYNSGAPDFILNHPDWPVGWWRMGDTEASSPILNILRETDFSSPNAALNGGAAIVSEVP